MEKIEKRIEKIERTLSAGDSFDLKIYLRSGQLMLDVQSYLLKGAFRPGTPEVVKAEIVQAFQEEEPKGIYGTH